MGASSGASKVARRVAGRIQDRPYGDSMKFAGAEPSAKEQRLFYAAVGKAITDWAHLEEELFGIVGVILGCDIELAAIVFYRTSTIESRLTLTSDVLEARFPKHKAGEHPNPSLKAWKELQKDIRDALPIRNRLAHHPAVAIVFGYSNDAQQLYGLKPASHVSYGEGIRSGKVPMPLELNHVEAHMQTVAALIDRVRRFRDAESLAGC